MRRGKGGGLFFVVFAFFSVVGIAVTWIVGSVISNSGLGTFLGTAPPPDADAFLVTTSPRLEVAVGAGAFLVLVMAVQILRQARDHLLAQRDSGPVRFRPPDGLRPAHVGLLLDGEVHEVDLVATIVDLAHRGALQLDEAPDGRGWSVTPGTDPGNLQEFEQILVSGLFAESQRVDTDSLRGRFGYSFDRVRHALLNDAVRHGWFRQHPDDVRWFWHALGLTGIVLSLVGGLVLAVRSDWSIVAIPVAVASVLLLIVSRWMPVRTRAGRTALRESAGFRRFIETAEAGRAEYADESGDVAPYLGYAIAMGLVDRWAERFEGIEDVNRLPSTARLLVGAVLDLSGGVIELGGALAELPRTPPPSSPDRWRRAANRPGSRSDPPAG